MKASLHIDLMHVFGIASSPPSNCQLPFIQMKNADVSYHRCAIGEAMLQEFDGLLGYLYQLDLCTTRALTIPISVDRGDLHALYLILAAGPIHIQDLQSGQSFILASQRACYLYLPPGRYELTAPSYHTALFGYYFRGELFRQGNERPFKLLHPLIQSYRQADSRSCCSIDFRVGPRTRAHIQQLLENVKRGDMDNEEHILHQMKALMKLSNEKAFDEYERTSDPQLLIDRCRKLLADQIAQQGNTALVKHVAQQLHVRPEYLSRLHQCYYGHTLAEYRSSLLTDKIKALLLLPDTLLAISLECGFQGPNEMSRFFKRQCGSTPAAYRRLLNNK